MNLITKVKDTFQQAFALPPLVVRSPGRINLIGEHTDYNQGFVLPGAIDKAIYIGIAPRSDDRVSLISLDFAQSHTFLTHELRHNDKPWTHFVMGVIEQFQKAGYTVPGFNCVIGGDVPLGAGLSSSAAFECAVAFGIDEIAGLGLTKMHLVQLAQKAENEFVGVKCGIMDQFASVFGQAGQVIQLDCHSLDYAYFPMPLNGISLVLCDSGVKHSLASSEYNVRRQQCEAGVALIQQKYPQVQSLRDVSLEKLAACKSILPPLVFNRCLYIVEENERLLEATLDLSSGDLVAFGKKMYATHAGLRDLYDVSCPELNVLVSVAEKDPHVLGARMMGGGFGGCTLNLVREEGLTAFLLQTKEQYTLQTGITPAIYIVSLSDGTSTIT